MLLFSRLTVLIKNAQEVKNERFLNIDKTKQCANCRHTLPLTERQTDKQISNTKWSKRCTQVRSTDFVRPSWGNNARKKTKQKSRKPRTEKVAISQQNKECLHKIIYIQSRIHRFIQRTHSVLKSTCPVNRGDQIRATLCAN